MAGLAPLWATLPTELLVAVLGRLTLNERHRAAVAVCKTWHNACYTPQLLRHLHIRGGRYGKQHYSLESLASLGSWLVRRRVAQHAHSITFSLVLPSAGPVLLGNVAELQQAQQALAQEEEDDDEVNQPPPAHPPLVVQPEQQPQQVAGGGQQFAAFMLGDGNSDSDVSDQEDSADEDPDEPELVATCLAAVAATATPSLTSMQLAIECITLTTGGWPGGLTALTRLGFANHEGGVRMSAQLRELRALRELSMVADRVSGQDHLPLTVTRLTWAEASLVAFLPRQLTAVRRLQHLELGCPNFDAEALNVLTELRSMRHLALNNTVLPTAMRDITWLRSLRILDSSRFRSADLPAALPALQQLTAIALGYVRLWQQGLVAALDQLPCLQRLVVCFVPDTTASSSRMEWPGLPDLPPPAFLCQLEWLGLDADLVMRNPHLLAAATQLRQLWLMGGCSPRHKAQWQQLLEVAGELPHLQRISLRPSRGSRAYWYHPLEQHQREELEALQRRRGLAVDEWMKLRAVTNNDELWGPFFSD